MKPLQTTSFLLLFLGILIEINAQKPKPTKFKIMSVNIQHGVSNDGKTNLLKLVDLIKTHQPDAVAIQEIDSCTTKSGKLNQIRILSLLTGYESIWGGAGQQSIGKTGLGILTKHPFEQVQVVPLPMPEPSVEKILLSAVLKLPNIRFLRLCNTQLDDKSILNRGVQAAILSRTLEMSLYPIVWCGDFIDTIEDQTIDFVNKKWDDAGIKNNTPTHLPTESRRHFFWTIKNSNVVLKEYKVLSEPKMSQHQPIICTFELR